MTLFDTLHFIRPWWLLLLPLAVLLPWLWKRSRRPSGDWARVCDPHLLQWLSVRQQDEAASGTGRWIAGLAVFLAVLALSGPSFDKLPDSSYSARDARVVVVDLSRSMLAEDLRPNRLTRARFRLADLLADTSEGQVGLVSYAGDAYVVSPLTNDTNTVINLLPALRPDIIPVAGSRADRGLDLAAELLERSGLGRGEILLVTDSADSRDAARARELSDRGILTSVLAVGTTDGAPIPSGGGFVADRAGNVVIARLDRSALQSVAQAGGGVYSELGASGGSLPWTSLESSEFDLRDDALGERWNDLGPWLVLLLIPLAVLAFRRGAFFMLPLCVLGGLSAPQEARAGLWDDLWRTRDQQAYQALQQSDPQRAAALADNPALSAEAWYRSEEYANASRAWSRFDHADAHYNRGTALAHAGEYDAAIEAFDRALALEPDMADAAHNKAIVEQMKQQQEQQQEQQGEDGESQDEQGEGEESEGEPQNGEQQEGEPQEGEPQQGEEQEGEPREGESQEGQQQEMQAQQVEAWSEEDAQAMEQWLRRIPDDPGGLLRRKFRNQHQRRGAPQDETESW